MSSLDDLNVGDEVRIFHGGFSGRESIQKITRKTAKQTIMGPYRFWTKNGNSVGGGNWSRTWAYPLEAGDKERIMATRNRNQAVADVKRIRFNILTDDQLQRISAILKETAA